jgi:hypothetical protein
MRAKRPKLAARKRKTAAIARASRPRIHLPEDFRFTDLLSPEFYKRRPGRPRKEDLDDGLPSWLDIMGYKDWSAEQAAQWFWNWQRRHQGRTPDQDTNQSLKDGYLAAKSQGTTMRAFVKKWFRQWHGCEPTPEEVKSKERQIDRLLKK